MNNPTMVTVLAGQWNLIASSVTSGAIYKHGAEGQFWQTFRVAGEDAPTDISEGEVMFIESFYCESVETTASADIYVWATVAGELRVDV